MVDNRAWEICERVAEVQAPLDDHIAGGKHAAADVIAKAQGVWSGPELLKAMWNVGHFPPKTRFCEVLHTFRPGCGWSRHLTLPN